MRGSPLPSYVTCYQDVYCVGVTVAITEGDGKGSIGTIIKVDTGSVPYNVMLPNGNSTWKKEDHFEFVSGAEAGQEQVSGQETDARTSCSSAYAEGDANSPGGDEPPRDPTKKKLSVFGMNDWVA